jgi:TonB-linked SusC/RagA family outer membrane protein
MNKYAFKRGMPFFRLPQKIVLIMKLIIIIMTTFLMQVSAAGFAQRVTLREHNVPLENVLQKIRMQTGYDILLSGKLAGQSQNVSIDVRNASLEAALDAIFQGQQLSYSIKDKSVVIFEKEKSFVDRISDYLTAIDINTTVLDERGSPLAGANIRVKGTNRMVITDRNGFFALNQLDDNAVLVISFLGYTTKELAASKINGPVRMELATAKLNEVTVTTAYGIEKRTKELGYSVAKITGEEINRANSGNVLQGLIGKVSGLNIVTQSSDMNPQMRILLRGIRSFGQSSNNQPLFILNGSPLSFGSDQDAAQLVLNFVNNLNPADVEDVTVLKGANGTAMYGPEGVNGVIIINTKKGAKGEAAINFRSNNSFQRVDFRNDYRQRTFGIGAGNLDDFGDGRFDPTSNYSWGPAYDGRMVPIGNPDENGNYQMVKYEDNTQARKFYNVAQVNRNNISFSQSDEKSSYYLGVGYVNQTGLLPGDKQQQATALLNTTRRMGVLSTAININYARTNDDRGPDVQGTINSLPTFIPILAYTDFENDYWSNPNRYWDGISPYQSLAIKRTKSSTNALSGSISFDLKPVQWLTITERPGLNYSGYYSKAQTSPVYFSDYAHTLPGKYYDLLPAVGEDMLSNTSLNNDVILSTVNDAGDFRIKTNFGNSIRQNYVKEIKAAAELSVPVYNLAFSRYPSSAIEDALLSRTISVFGNTLIGYKDMVFLELTGRNEWDSKRAKVARGKDLYFGANSSVVLNEVFPALANWKWLSTSRFRASIAQSANMNIAPFQSERLLGLVQGYPFNYGELLGYSFSQGNPNPLLKPEKVFSQEYGLSLGFLENRFTLDMAYYYQKNNSVILNVREPFLTGAPSIDNAGSFQNQGLEVDLKLNPLVRLPNGMSLIVDGRFSINDNKVLSLSDAYNGIFRGMDSNGNQYYARTGHSAYEYAVRDWTRDSQGRVIVDKTTGMPLDIDFDAYEVYGKTLPKYTASLGLNFVWKNFSASVLADAAAGNDHLFNTSTNFYVGSHPLTTLNNRERYVFPNSSYDDGAGNYVANNDVVVSNAGQQLYSKFSLVNAHGLVNGAFLKIREFSMQYKLPWKTWAVKDPTLSVYARDLFSFYPVSNVVGDPGLVKGPGQRDFKTLNSNLNGGSSEDTALPGTVLYGFTVSFRF